MLQLVLSVKSSFKRGCPIFKNLLNRRDENGIIMYSIYYNSTTLASTDVAVEKNFNALWNDKIKFHNCSGLELP